MKKKFLKSTIIVAVLTVASYGGTKAYGVYVKNTNGINSMLAQNIEALTYIETSTSWYCSGDPLFIKCSAYCGSCGTKVESVGKLSGFHSCWEQK